MNISTAEDKQNKILGEAAMNLVLRQEEVSVMTLLSELQSMSGSETDPARAQSIEQTLKWLMDFRRPGRRFPEERWANSSPEEGTNPEDGIILMSQDEDVKP